MKKGFQFVYKNGRTKEYTLDEMREISFKRSLKLCKKTVKQVGFVRVGRVVKSGFFLNHVPYNYKRVASKLVETGKYISKEITNSDGEEDFEIYRSAKKPIQERLWWLWGVLGAVGVYILNNPDKVVQLLKWLFPR